MTQPISVQTRIASEHYRVQVTSGKNSLVSDEPVDNGGKEEGLSPHRLLLGALGACTCITIRMYADRKQMRLEEIQVNLSLEKDAEKNITNISRDIIFTGELTDEEKSRLLQIADKCPVHKTLTNPIQIKSQLK